MTDLPPSQMPTLGDENRPESRMSPSAPMAGRTPPRPYPMSPPPPRSSEGRTALWVIIAMLVGFMVPICTCISLVALTFLGFASLVNQFEPEAETGPAIGIIDLNGIITGGNSFGASRGYLLDQIEWMEKNSDVRAIVVRANSPGGDASASDEIWYALSQVEKPVVISMQGLCASGCLYIASAGDEIFATRNSLVGSIGVISTFFNAEELIDEIGVEVEVIATGNSKDFGSLFRELTPEEEAYWREQIAVTLDHFIQTVANRPGSQLSTGQVRELATGEVWVAPIAFDLKLIDQIGYEEQAIERAADLANLRNYRLQEYPLEFNLLRLFSPTSFLQDVPEGLFELPNTYDVLESFQQPALQYRYFGPYDGSSFTPPAEHRPPLR